MINYDEEIKKFKPSLEIDDAENEILKNDMKDVSDVIEKLVNLNQPKGVGIK